MRRDKLQCRLPHEASSVVSGRFAPDILAPACGLRNGNIDCDVENFCLIDGIEDYSISALATNLTVSPSVLRGTRSTCTPVDRCSGGSGATPPPRRCRTRHRATPRRPCTCHHRTRKRRFAYRGQLSQRMVSGHSRAIASIGDNLAARRAGYVPNATPTATAEKTASSAVVGFSTG